MQPDVAIGLKICAKNVIINSMSVAIEQSDFVWQPVIDGVSRDVPIDVYVAEGALEEGTPQNHVYLGMGEHGFASRSTLKTLHEIGVPGVAAVLPFHHLPCTDANIERTIIEAPHAIAQEMNRRANNGSAPVPVGTIGHSQGASVFLSGNRAPELFDIIGAWSPDGLTSDNFGSTSGEKKKEFFNRFLQNILCIEQNPVFHPGNIIAAAEILNLLLADCLNGRVNTKFDYALNVNLIGPIMELVDAGKSVAIFGPESDPIFPGQEYLEALGKVGLAHIFQRVSGSHTNPLVRPGKKQLQVVGNWLLESRNSPDTVS
jgi:hypothetical protein